MSAEEGSSQNKRPRKRGREEAWKTLQHNGVLLPKPYVRHKVRMQYKGERLKLHARAEEVATLYAQHVLLPKLSVDDTFNTNFCASFNEALKERGQYHIESLDDCDFQPIVEHLHKKQRTQQKLSEEEQAALRAQKRAEEAPYRTATLDGQQVKVTTYKIDAPSLILDADHERRGYAKLRIKARDVKINIQSGLSAPRPPYSQPKWKKVCHEPKALWLASWPDPSNPSHTLYTYTERTSPPIVKREQDKYAIAQKLSSTLDEVRQQIQSSWESTDVRAAQVAVVIYLIDKLALRAGHRVEGRGKDTVGCCNLRVEHVRLSESNTIHFEFLGKGGVQYSRSVQVLPAVYELVAHYRKHTQSGQAKQAGSLLFDAIDGSTVNRRLKRIMRGLTCKVFRTCLASQEMERQLRKQQDRLDEEGKQLVAPLRLSVPRLVQAHEIANLQVARLCNHQRAVPKQHDSQVAKLWAKVAKVEAELAKLKKQRQRQQARVASSSHQGSSKPGSSKEGSGKEGSSHQGSSKEGSSKAGSSKEGSSKEGSSSKEAPPEQKSWIDAYIRKANEKLVRLEYQIRQKEEAKGLATCTSRAHYIDPRITVAWCKRNDLPVEAVWPPQLIKNFAWATETPASFVFEAQQS